MLDSHKRTVTYRTISFYFYRTLAFVLIGSGLGGVICGFSFGWVSIIFGALCGFWVAPLLKELESLSEKKINS